MTTARRESPVESAASLPVCVVCGALADRADDPVVITTWVRDRSGGRVTWTCADCSRRHVRDIEGKLDAKWW
ncbi:MAG: hypothetical protein V9F04_10915 [Dermatophilaceae bacterium]